jgi:hypothetical protein
MGVEVRKELGIKAGEIWAFRESSTVPLMRARIIDPGTHYDAYIQSVLIDYAGQPSRSGRRRKYPCKWERLEDYLERERDNVLERRGGGAMARVEPPVPSEGLNVKEPELLALVVGKVAPTPIAYGIAAAANAVGYSETTIRHEITNGMLRARYANSKPVILHDELWKWAHNLPLEQP